MFTNVQKKSVLFTCQNCGAKYKEQIEFCEECGKNRMELESLHKKKNTIVNGTNIALNNKLQGQIQIIAVIEIAFGIIGLLIGLLFLIIAPFMDEIVRVSSLESGEPILMYQDFFMLMFLLLGSFFVIFSVLGIFSGIKLYNLQNNGRFGTMIIACLMLVIVPFGTVFAIISLVLLSKPETIELMRERNKYL